MKNWLKFTHGTWINGQTWQSESVVYIDPAAVIAVQTSRYPLDYPEGCLIFLRKGVGYCVRESAEHVIAQIQSGLP